MSEIDLEPRIIEALKDSGYTVLKKVGSGQLNNVYRVLFKKGSFEQLRIAKIPKTDLSDCSINALINLSKMDVHENEVVQSNKLSHPNIIEFIDYIPLGEGVNAIIEEDINATSLEEIVQLGGGLSDGAFNRIFKGVVEGLYYAHQIKGVLHRDITPANIFAKRYDEGVKIGDWENARIIRDIEEQMLPTRGGTAYTHPELLNALLNGGACASRETEIYALGATMYYALTGEKPFDYEIDRDPDGMPLDLGGKVEYVSLFANGSRCKSITKKDHEKNLKRALQKIPRKYSKLVEKCLSLDSGYVSIFEVKTDLEKIARSRAEKIVEGAKRYAKIAGLAFVMSFAAVLAVYMGFFMEKNVRSPTLSDLLRHQHKIERISQGHHSPFGEYGEDDFSKYLREYRKRGKAVEERIKRALDFASGQTITDRRVAYSLLRSISMSINGLDYEIKKGKTPRFLIPEDFVKHYTRSENPEQIKRAGVEAIFMIKYLNHCYKHGDSLEDMYVKALCSKEEISKAIASTIHKRISRKANKDSSMGMVSTGTIADTGCVTSIGYFARVEDGRFIPGYRSELNPAKRKIIDRAIALYGVTDRKGELSLWPSEK